MKNRTGLLILSFFLMTGIGCNNDSYEYSQIIKELPRMNLMVDDDYIIQTSQEMERILETQSFLAYKEQYEKGPQEGFADEYYEEIKEIYEGLTEIDFSSQTLLIGKGWNGHMVGYMKHEFRWKSIKHYKYTVYVDGMLTAIDNFSYAIVVNKLPQDVKVDFAVERATYPYQ